MGIKLQRRESQSVNAQEILIAESISREFKRQSKPSEICKVGTFRLRGFLELLADDFVSGFACFHPKMERMGPSVCRLRGRERKAGLLVLVRDRL